MDEELQTAVVKVEGILNSAHSLILAAFPTMSMFLTPNHLLYCQIGRPLAPRFIDDLAFNPEIKGSLHKISCPSVGEDR